MERANYALPLFSMVDREKVDPGRSPLDELAENLLGFLNTRFNIGALDARIELLQAVPYLVLNGVPREALPKLLALADVQRTQLFAFQRDAPDRATLTPLAVSPDESS